MLLAHRLNPLIAIFVVAATGLGAFFMVMHAISNVAFTSTAQYHAQHAQAEQTAEAAGARSR